MITRCLPALVLFTLSTGAFALPVCPDRDAKSASDVKALSYFRKQHHPSRDKEVASYVKVGDKHYSIFTLVNPDCEARFIKRTRQGD